MRNALCLLSALFVFTAADQCFAQRGGPSPERFFQMLDRDGDGMLRGDELRRFPPMRDIIEEMEIDTDRGVDLREFEDIATEMRRRMEERGFGGPPRGGDDSGDRGGFDRGRRSFRGRGGDDDDDDRDGDRGRSRGDRRGSRGSSRGDDDDEDSRGSRGGDRSSRGFSRGGDWSRRSSRDEGRRGGRSGESEQKKERPRVTLDLPSSYASKDRNGDGQLGLYEWPQDDLAAFARLDFNGDGFLTPRELQSPDREPTRPAAPSVASRRSFSRPAASSTPSPEIRTASRSGGESGGGDRFQVAAERAFRGLDRNKNDSVEPEEFQRSRSTRPLFEKGGVDISQVMSKDGFIAHYVRLRSQ